MNKTFNDGFNDGKFYRAMGLPAMFGSLVRDADYMRGFWLGYNANNKK